MAFVASVHIADVGAAKALSRIARGLKPGAVPGLLHANVASAAAVTSSMVPPLTPGRLGIVAFWRGDDDLSRFLAEDPLAAAMADGWRTRLEPLRASGSWPGLPPELATSRTTGSDGPSLVLTLGRLRLTQAVRFLRASAKAQAGVVAAPGLIWATGLARPPFVSTCSLWESPNALMAYAYGPEGAPHPGAMASDRAKPFHRQSAFVRFRPYDVAGRLGGSNPLAEHALSV